MICFKCKTSIPDTAKFCPKCGAMVEYMEKRSSIETEEIKYNLICPKCRTTYSQTAKFCKKDGTPLQKFPSLEVKLETETYEVKPEEIKPEIEKPKNILYCPKCGISYPLTAKFCKKDGTPLEESVPSTKPKIIREAPPKVEIRKPSRRITWIIASGLFVLLNVSLGYLYYSGKISKRQVENSIASGGSKPSKHAEPPKAQIEAKPAEAPETRAVSQKEEKSFEPEISNYIDLAELERRINRELRNKGLRDVYVKVDEDLIATLNGTVQNPRDKTLTLMITEKFEELKDIRDNIQVVEPPPIEKIDPSKLEDEISIALRNAGLKGITLEVRDDLTVTLKGTVRSSDEKEKAIQITKKIKGIKKIKDVIFVVEQ